MSQLPNLRLHFFILSQLPSLSALPSHPFSASSLLLQVNSPTSALSMHFDPKSVYEIGRDDKKCHVFFFSYAVTICSLNGPYVTGPSNIVLIESEQELKNSLKKAQVLHYYGEVHEIMSAYCCSRFGDLFY
ncbi:hypothetical protein ACLOJK_021853 [Asimina triloba]